MISTITPINKEEIESRVVRPMGELELYGAISYIYEVIKNFEETEFGECHLDWNDIDNDTFYSNKRLEMATDYTVKDSEGNYCVIDRVFMLEGNDNVLFGLVHSEDLNEDGTEYLDDTYYVRFDA